MNKNINNNHEVICIRFTGDSGDGMQLTGDRLAKLSAILGNDVLTLADFPAEIRAPAGSLHGISGYQMTIGSNNVFTSGDSVDILIAMNPAALQTNLKFVKKGGTLILNKSSFIRKNLEKAKYLQNPLDDNSLKSYRIIAIEITKLTRESLKNSSLGMKDKDRCKNFFALGVICWLLSRNIDSTIQWISKKFKNKEFVIEANQTALKAGYNFGYSNQLFSLNIPIKKNINKSGKYRYINGNSAVALSLVCASSKSKRKLFLGSYPITPATEILHYLSSMRQFNVTTYQAEDEIAAIGSAIGASFAGSLAITTTSGPGIALKSELINLAIMTELPLVIINVQRAGPSTGLPTKTEQSDLLQSLWGRNGESPIVVLAASSPSNCFDVTYEACRIACKYMTPVIVLTDGYLANGSEGWRIPNLDDLPAIITPPTPKLSEGEQFMPNKRFSSTLSRAWVSPGEKGFEHRVGGLESNEAGRVSYEGEYHQKMVDIRQNKINGIAREIKPLEIFGSSKGEILILGWGSTFGAIRQAVKNINSDLVSHCHLRFINPFPLDLKYILSSFKKILLPENNLGQLAIKIKSEYNVKIESLSKVQGSPFLVSEIELKIRSLL